MQRLWLRAVSARASRKRGTAFGSRLRAAGSEGLVAVLVPGRIGFRAEEFFYSCVLGYVSALCLFDGV